MENLADALKIAFAVFVFVSALAITFTFVSKAKTTADVVLYHADKTNFYEKANSKSDNRQVNVETVVTALYRSSEETMNVKVIKKNGEKICEFCATSIIDINNFLDENMKELKRIEPYTEEFIEVPYSGIYKTGTDGAQITLSSGQNKVYITYKATKD